MKISSVITLSLAVLLVSACMKQPPAEIVYKGTQFFGQEHERVLDSPDHETYAQNSPRYKPGFVKPAEPAAVPAVSVSELPPPAVHKEARLQDSAPSAGGNPKHVLTIRGKDAAEVKEQQAEDVHEVARAGKVSASSAKDASQFIWPVDGGKVISRFNANQQGNDGINIAMTEGEPIYSSAAGTVVYAGNELQGYGNMVIVRHANGWMTAYAHARNLAVKKGDKVKQGDLIAYVGSTGNVKKPQLHFVLRKNKTPVNPEEYLPHTG